MSRVCEIEGCGVRIASHVLMCRRHWFRVPRELRERVLRTYWAWQRGDTGIEDLRVVQQEAVRAVESDRGRQGGAA